MAAAQARAEGEVWALPDIAVAQRHVGGPSIEGAWTAVTVMAGKPMTADAAKGGPLTLTTTYRCLPDTIDPRGQKR